MKTEETFVTKVEIKTLGYLIGQGPNDPQPSKVLRQNAVEIVTPRERSIFGDKPEYKPVAGATRKISSLTNDLAFQQIEYYLLET